MTVLSCFTLSHHSPQLFSPLISLWVLPISSLQSPHYLHISHPTRVSSSRLCLPCPLQWRDSPAFDKRMPNLDLPVTCLTPVVISGEASAVFRRKKSLAYHRSGVLIPRVQAVVQTWKMLGASNPFANRRCVSRGRSVKSHRSGNSSRPFDSIHPFDSIRPFDSIHRTILMRHAISSHFDKCPYAS